MVLVTRDHMTAFGAITHYYACAESGLKICLAGMAEMDLRVMLIFTEPYSAVNLRNVCKSIAKAKYLPDDPLGPRFTQLAGDLGAFGPLRNHIAHSRWTRGQRQGSIRPFGVDIRSGAPKFHGLDPSERDWTSDELLTEADKLSLLNRRIVQFITDSGISEAMAENDAASSASTEADEGISDKA